MENVLSLYPGQSWDTSILPVLSSYGESFMDAVCRDSCDGHDVGRVSESLHNMPVLLCLCLYSSSGNLPSVLFHSDAGVFSFGCNNCR